MKIYVGIAIRHMKYDIHEQTANSQIVQRGSIDLPWPWFFNRNIYHVCHKVTTVLEHLRIIYPLSRGHPRDCRVEMANIVMEVSFLFFFFFLVNFHFQSVSPGCV